MMPWYQRLFTSRRKPIRREPQRARPGVETLEARVLLAVNVLTYHVNNASTGLNASETSLTPTNVNASSFGKLFATGVDGQVYAEPLYKAGVKITVGSNQGLHNVVFVATQHDSLYAIDANHGQVLWQDSFIDPAHGITTVSSSSIHLFDIQPEIGITSTPVIDASSNTLYLTAKTQEVSGGNTHYVYRLHAINIFNGAEKFGGPVVIGDTISNDLTHYTYVAGPSLAGAGDGIVDNDTTFDGGDPDVDGKIVFNAMRQLQRPALTLTNGTIYLGFASVGDVAPYHGWVLGYNAHTLQLSAVFNTTPNGSDGGIWESGGRIDIDSAGNLFLPTGNGTFDGSKNSQGQTIGLDANGFPVNGDYGDSVLKLAVDPNSTAANPSLNGWGLKVLDYFTPFNQAGLNNEDFDLGSGGTMLLPDSAGGTAHPHLMLAAGKEGTIYLIDRDNMGKFDPNTDHIVQEIPGALNRAFDTPAYFNHRVYYVGATLNDVAKAYSLVKGVMSNSPTSKSSDTYGYPGSTPVVTANGTSNGIVWDLDRGTGQLRAYDASSYGTELYTSAQAAGNRDQLGAVIKFTVPTVVNGMVYVGTATSLVAYGLLVVPTNPPAAPSNLTATAISSTQINLTWRANSNDQNGFYIEDSTDGVNFTQVATASSNATSFSITGLQAFTLYTFRVRAFNTVGTSTYSDPASAATPAGVGAGGLDFSSGFAGATGLQLNGVAALVGSNLQLVSGGQSQTGSAFSTSTVGIGKFTSQFSFQLVSGSALGITFTIEKVSPTALGQGGSGLGYGGTKKSVAIKFDLFDDAGEGYDSTGLYTNGATPTIPAIDLSNTGINLGSGDQFNVGMTYDGTTLMVTITDTTANTAVTEDYTVNIPGVIGASTAFVGFTASSGKNQTAAEDILSWTFTPIAAKTPAAPSNLTATASAGTQVTLSWSDNSNNETGFLIERKTGTGGTYSQVATVGANVATYIDSGLDTGTQYVYRIRAINEAGTSDYSSEARANTPTLPPDPSSLQTTLVTTGEIDLAWQDNSDNEDGFNLYRQTGGSGDFFLVASLPADTTSYKDASLSAGTLYTYHLQAFNLAGPSGVDELSVTTVTAAPTSVSASPGNGQVTVSWTAPTGAATFNVYKSTTRGGEGSTPYQTGLTTTSFTDTGLTNGSTYYYEVTAVDSGGESSLSSEVSAIVGQGVAVSLGVSGFASPTSAGTAGTVTVTVLDALGATVTDYTGTVHFTSSDGQAALPADYTFASGDNGVHTFSVTLKTAGSQSLTATDTTTSSVTGTETGITVAPAAASSLRVSGFPSPNTAGVPGTVTVTALDAYGNVATSYTGTVAFTSSDPKALLPAPYTFTSTNKGVHTFHPTLRTAGTQSLTLTDTVTASITGAQTGIAVNPAAAKSFKVTGFPGSITAGTSATFTVTVRDVFGNIVTGYVGTVHVTSSDGAAALPSDYTFTGNDAGVHTFSATLNTPGTQSITATDTAKASLTGTETGIKVTAPSPKRPRPGAAPDSGGAGSRDGSALAESDGPNDL
jgi:fibronectin type 3 domain-containing protein